MKQCSAQIVFRIDKGLFDGRTRLTIDGAISRESIEVIEQYCDEAIADGNPVELFLRDVRTVDEAGRALLCRLASRGFSLLANGVYASYLIEAANQMIGGQRSR